MDILLFYFIFYKNSNRTNINLYTYENNIATINDITITFYISQYTFSPNFFRNCINYEATLQWSFHSRGKRKFLVALLCPIVFFSF